jgi:hypothetical protein
MKQAIWNGILPITLKDLLVFFVSEDLMSNWTMVENRDLYAHICDECHQVTQVSGTKLREAKQENRQINLACGHTTSPYP